MYDFIEKDQRDVLSIRNIPFAKSIFACSVLNLEAPDEVQA